MITTKELKDKIDAHLGKVEEYKNQEATHDKTLSSIAEVLLFCADTVKDIIPWLGTTINVVSKITGHFAKKKTEEDK